MRAYEIGRKRCEKVTFQFIILNNLCMYAYFNAKRLFDIVIAVLASLFPSRFSEKIDDDLMG